MDTKYEQNRTSALQGNLLRIGERREIAIYLRDGTPWVAEFNDGRGELFAVGAWFSLNQGGRVLRRMEPDSIAPLPQDVVQRIERLHRGTERRNNVPVMVRALAAAGLRGKLARPFRSLVGPRPARPLDPAM